MMAWQRRLLLPFLLLDSVATATIDGGVVDETEIITGQGEWKYRYRRMELPKQAQGKVQDGHGLALDEATGDIYYTFNPISNNTQVLVRFSSAKGAQSPQLLGDALLSEGVPHGLRLEGSFLYHANNAQRVTKTTLDGQVVWSTDFTDWESQYPQYWPIRPTDAVPVPNTDLLLVADGYGSNYVHLLCKSTGKFLGEDYSFGGGPGNSTDPLRFSTPHGISLDHATYDGSDSDEVQDLRFIVSDRANHRLVWVTINGEFVKAVDMQDSTPLPCNVDNSMLIGKQQHRMSVVPSLGQEMGNLTNATVGIYDENDDRLVSTLEIAKLLGHEGHQHPHDAIFLPNSDLVVCCWAGPNEKYGPSKGTISYWERLSHPPTSDNTPVGNIPTTASRLRGNSVSHFVELN